MAKGELKLEGLTHQEHRAALAAVKLVRGDSIKNAFMEGYCHGYGEALEKYRNGRTEGDIGCWDRSQAKALSESKVPETK